MKEARVFTKKELKEMGTLTRELIKAAIDADDKVRAKELTDRMYGEFLEMHDMYMFWVTALLTFIGRRYGDKILEEALMESWTIPVQSFQPEWQQFEKEGNLRGKAERMARGLRGHLMPIDIKEDEEKFVFEMQPCGSGGRLMLNRCYEPPVNFLKIEKPQPMTFGQNHLPVYCSHAAIMAMLATEFGELFWVEQPSDKVGEKRCKIYVYKDPKTIPAEIYAKLGKKKSSGKQRSRW